MTIDEASYKRMPGHIQALFVKAPNPSSEQVVGLFPETGISSGGRIGNAGGGAVPNIPTREYKKGDPGFGDTGSAARFFYTAKVAPSERDGSTHPTMKPVALMRWLIRLVCPPGGLLLDPFAGSGTTGVAAREEERRCILIEQEAEYFQIASRRVAEASKQLALFPPVSAPAIPLQEALL